MVGKKMFFLKAMLRSEKLRDQISFDDFLSRYTKEKLTAFANSDIHNDRNNEKNLAVILFKTEWERDDAFFIKEGTEKLLECIKYEVREHDVIAKWEEDEFMILLPECSYESAQKIAHLIKSIVDGRTFVNMKVDLQYGITIHEVEDTPDSFMQRAESQLQKCEEV
ncbi:MAG: diguanylate cyclase [Epsilonproteobacteria bacterium]|nr:diguanylate cyclase [Campylobacterota bacterium]